MTFFIRFTDTPKADLKRGNSYHLSDVKDNGYKWNKHFNCYAEKLDGLCAFGYYESLEDCHEEADKKQRFSGCTKNYAILTEFRAYIEGSIGCVVSQPKLVSSHTIK